MPEVSFASLFGVLVVAFVAPVVAAFARRFAIPSVVLEIVAGIAIGPAGFGLVAVDEPIAILAVIGLAFLLFLAGLEIDLHELGGAGLRLALLSTAVSFVLTLGVGFALDAAGLASAPLLLAVALVATSLGLVVAVLKDADLASSPVGQLVLAAATVSDFAAVILLSLLFSRDATGSGTRLVLLGTFVVLILGVAFGLARAGRVTGVAAALERLADTTAQIRVRAAMVLLIGFVALAARFGLETILGAFMAGAIIAAVDRDTATHPHFRVKLEAIGFGFFIPVFFVTSGLRFDLEALFGSGRALALVPVFLVALLVVRGVPALVYRGRLGRRDLMVAALLQATSLPFLVAASQIGMELGSLDEATGAALVSGGLLSVLVFPPLALMLARRSVVEDPVAPVLT